MKALLPFRGSADGETTMIPLSAEETQKVDDEFAKWRKEWTSRKKVYKE